MEEGFVGVIQGRGEEFKGYQDQYGEHPDDRQSDQMWRFIAKFWLFLGSIDEDFLAIFNIFWLFLTF